MKKVELVQMSKSYNFPTNVLENITVSIEPGEFFVLVGPSGCGKSTLLRMIAGLEDISAGKLFIGENYANLLRPSQRGISFVFQNYALYPHLTVRENIVFGLQAQKVPKGERNKRCNEVAEMLGLIPFLKRKPRELSGGQRQRVALARSIVSQAPICLMDEPLSNLDAKLRAHMRSEIKQIQRRLGLTMIYVTHDQVEAMTMGDRIMVLNDGKIQQIGDPLQIYNHPANAFVAQFIGSPPMNLIQATFNKQKQSIQIGDHHEILVPLYDVSNISSDDIIIGIRPENIRLSRNEPNHFLIEVVNVEVLGTETIIFFKLMDQQCSIKWNGQWRIDVGDRIPVRLDYQVLSIFDSKTGIVLKKPNIDTHYKINEVKL
ncbi:ABC transporter ATP-binding protein [Chengkuizengella sediminis]|uniref:ABC transporter ATP-binding protein n=1 Tax=Chengkuizengella sediminis TaxID=1885917 RepID=UPI0013893FC6|nr:ABC transporter ATP-binding protein [Chengkuizengella sediminis]NDI35427.1 ABC transporter ATP-binding protein [Chengkuizengella sediminis]